MKVSLTRNKEELKEIYQLRVACYEATAYADKINAKQYPNGYQDSLDSSAHHFIVKHEGKILAASRLCLVENIQEIPFSELFSGIESLPTGPVWFFSRLAVRYEYRGKGLKNLLDQARISFLQKQPNKCPVLMIAKSWRISSLEKLGARVLGKVHIGNSSEYPFATDEPTYILKLNIA